MSAPVMLRRCSLFRSGASCIASYVVNGGRGTDSIFVAVNVRGYPCDGRLLEKDVDGIDKIKTIFARIRFESWLADANGRIIITCNNTLAVGNIVGLGQSVAQQKKSIKT